MSRPSYGHDPDGVLDLDRGATAGRDLRTKAAALLPAEEAAGRSADRAGYRDLDLGVEAAPRLTRGAKDRERATPRETVAALGHPRKARPLPGRQDRRRTLSARQRAARSKTKRQVQERLTGTQHRELSRLLSDERGRWAELNDALSEAAGDIQQLPEQRITQIQRIDRAIQSYETANDRSHVVYTNVRLPAGVQAGETLAYLREHLPAGDEVAVDRFTLAAHTVHELDDPSHDGTVVVMEIATRRGMYLGQSGSGHDTAHLLPRGIRLQVGDIHRADYDRADGTIGRRTVIQLTDTTGRNH